MKVFNIHEWDTSYGLTHYATTWIVTDALTGGNEIYRIDESTEHLLGFDLNITIPVGSVYYVKALRFLKDVNDIDIGYDKWIGPIKIINDDSNQSDVIVPNTYISTPSITNLNIDVVTGLNITLSLLSSNVPHLSTHVIIESDKGIEVYSESHIVDKLNIIIPNSVFNFTTVDFFKIKIMFIGDLNTISNVLTEKHSYVSNFYKVIGNINKIDPTTNTTLKVIPTDTLSINIVSANIYTLENYDVNILEDNVVVNCIINNNEIIISEDVLKYKTTYNLVIELTYIDPLTSVLITKLVRHNLSTREENEIPTFNKDTIYIDELKLIKIDHAYVIDNRTINTEQSLYGIIPFIDSSVLKLYTYNEDNSTYSILKDTGIIFPNSYFKIEFLPNNRFIVFYDGGTGLTDAKIYDYDYYTDDITLITTFNNLSRANNLITNSFTLIDNKYYFYDYNDSNTTTTLTIKYIDLINMVVVTYKDLVLEDLGSFTYCNVTLIDKNRILIVPMSSSLIYSYIYDFNHDTVMKGPVVPITFRNTYMVSRRLINGNVLYTLYNSGNNKEYMLFDNKTSTMVTNNFITDTLEYFKINISFKSGVFDFVTHEPDNNLDIYRYQ